LPRPFPDMRVMSTIRRNEVTNVPQRLQAPCERGIERDWRMEEKIAIRKFHDSHPRWERPWQLDSQHCYIFERSIDDADASS